MTPELQKALADMIAVVNTAAQRELPLVVQEYLRWGVAEAWLGIGTAVALGAACYAFLRVAYWLNDNDKERHDAGFFPFLISVICGIAAPFLLAPNVYHLIQIHVAPRVYLLEQLQGVLR